MWPGESENKLRRHKEENTEDKNIRHREACFSRNRQSNIPDDAGAEPEEEQAAGRTDTNSVAMRDDEQHNSLSGRDKLSTGA